MASNVQVNSSGQGLAAGIDIGSTTIKLVVLDKDNQVVYKKYMRHLS